MSLAYQSASYAIEMEPVIDNLPSAIIVVDRDRRVLLANQIAAAFGPECEFCRGYQRTEDAGLRAAMAAAAAVCHKMSQPLMAMAGFVRIHPTRKSVPGRYTFRLRKWILEMG